MKHKLLSCLLTAVLTLSTLALPASASVRVQVDGEVLAGTSYLKNGVTYVPIRTAMNALGNGWEVYWDSERQAAVAYSEEDTIIAGIGETHLHRNGIAYPTAGTVYLQNGTTYVPLRALAELCGGWAEWDPWMAGAAVTSAEFDLPCSASDYYWLSRIISAESMGESLQGQIAVGNVVLNRVASREFPDNIPGVIFDRTDGIQFEPTGNGTVYAAPTEQSIEAARQVLTGASAVEGAMYFYAPALSEGTWINANRTYLTTIGCHRFYL